MRIIVTKDYNDMSRKAANIISAQIITKPDCVLGLATASDQRIYEKGRQFPRKAYGRKEKHLLLPEVVS